MKKRIIKYMEDETDFKGSFDSIKDKIHVQNIVIKEKNKRDFKLFKSKGFKIAFACLATLTTVLAGKGLYDIVSTFNTPSFEIVNKSLTYDNYEDFKNDYEYYQAFSTEKEKKIFEINIDGVESYSYHLDFEAKYESNQLISINRYFTYLSLKYNESSCLSIFYLDRIDDYSNIFWEVLFQDNNIYYLKNNENKNILKMNCLNLSNDQISYIQSYLIVQIKK